MIKKILGFLFSARMTVICLLLMAVVVIWGTIFEASEGLYAARERFFQSWLTGFIIPFPGIKLISLLLLINLSGSFWGLCQKLLKNSGLLLIHLGIALLLFGLIFSAQFTREYFLNLQEGETASLIYSSSSFELAVYKQIHPDRFEFYASDSIPLGQLETGKEVSFPVSGVKCKIKSISKIKNSEKGGNTPVYQIILTLNSPCNSKSGNELILKSGDQPLELKCNTETLYLTLRPVSIPLPISIRLVEFSKRFHPGTEILKEVSSHLSVRSNNSDRDVIVSMNKPLRYESFTFYQASFSHQGEKEISNFSVIYNPHRLFPYFASILMIGGFMIHLMILTLRKYVESKPKKS
ncbi:MAG: hypothetical protein GX640_10175 [Fibrobacter sp.]|nr:hypothetical protein [Fibrobacter sp.]